MRRRDKLTLLPKSPLLITESADEFDAVRDAFEQEIKPHGIMPSKKFGPALDAGATNLD
jgi:hypothetical protein